MKKKNKKVSIRKILIILFLLLAVIGVFLFFRKRNQKTSVNAEVRTSTVTRGNLTSSLSSSGTLEPKDTYSITSLVDGEVISADFEEGDMVEKDQVLYQIDSSSMESQITSVNNSLERAKKNQEKAIEDYQEAVEKYSGNTYKSTRTGYIKTLNIEVGDKVSTNTDLAVLYSDEVMKVRVPFLSMEAEQISVGQTAVLTMTDTEETLEATVTAVANLEEVLEGGRMVKQVTLEVSNPGGLTTSHSVSVQIGDFYALQEGTFEPTLDKTMQAEVTGNGTLEVEQLLVHDGDYITVGTPLFQIVSSDVQDILDDYQDAVDSADEKVESAQTNLDNTQDNYDNYVITAPISGQVITKNTKVGDNLSNNNTTTTMAVIYDLSELTFEMSIDELDIMNVKVGQKVEVTADAYEGKTYTGTVTNVSLESSYSNGVTNYPVTVTLDDEDDLLPGMNVDGVIILDEAEDVLMVPIDSLMRGNIVYVQDESVTETNGPVPSGFREVEVETGLTSEDYVEIVSGLEEGDIVYVNESSTTSSAWSMGNGMQGMQGQGMRQGGGPGM